MNTFQQLCLDLKKSKTPHEPIPFASGEGEIIMWNGKDKVKLVFNRLGSLVQCYINQREVLPFVEHGRL